MITKFREYLRESITFQSAKDWLEDKIQNIKGFVRMKRMKDKYTDFLDRLDSFSETKNIEKKELTQIRNAFDKLCASYYNERLNAHKDELYDKLGVKSYQYKGPFGFFHLYGLKDAERYQTKFDSAQLKPEEQEFIDKYFDGLENWVELYNKIEEVRKILNPTAEERKARELLQIKGRVNPKIREAIDNIAERFRKVIEKNEYESYKRIIEKYLEDYGETITYQQIQKDRWTPTIIMKVYQTGKEQYYGDYKIIADWDDKIKKIAKDYSHEVIQSFQYKMYDKIGGMISDINKPFDVDVTGRGLRSNNITFNFTDGSRFSIKNKIVSNTNQQGTFYYTYPTTFHDAYLPNNEKIPNPNEYTVKKAFNDYYIEMQKYNL